MSRTPAEPAFPSSHGDRLRMGADDAPGMSLRDYFAAKALAALLVPMLRDSPAGQSATRDAELAAKASYELADAMLRAREAA